MPWLERMAAREARRLQHFPTVDLTDQIHALQRELAAVQGQMQRRGGALQHDAGDFAHDAAALAGRATHQLAGMAREHGQQLVDAAREQGTVLAHEASRQAVRAGRAVRADPVPTLVAIAALAMLVRLLMPRR